MQMIYLVLMLGRLGGKSALPDMEDSLVQSCVTNEDSGKKISRYIPGAPGIAGEIIRHRKEKTQPSA